MSATALDADHIDVALDELIPLRVAAALVPRRRRGAKCSVQCMYRWTSPGVRGVRLRFTQAGCTRCTTRRWLREFFDTLAAQSQAADAPSDATDGTPETDASLGRTRTERRRAIDRAESDAEALGV